MFLATLNGNLCAYFSAIHFVHPKVRDIWRAHRIVVLPEYQGIGVGTAFCNAVGRALKLENKRLHVVTSNVAFIRALQKSPDWVCTFVGRQTAPRHHGLGKTSSKNRITATFEYKSNERAEH